MKPKSYFLQLATYSLSVTLCLQPMLAFANEKNTNTVAAVSSLSSSKLVMTNQEFLNWFQAKPAVNYGTNQNGIQPVSISGSDANTKTLAAHIETFAYTLGPGDVLSIQILGKPELSRDDITLNTDGLISLPLIGDFQAVGKTTQQFSSELSDAYSEYLIEPSVNVVVKKTRPQVTYVLGSVKNPGPYFQVSKESNNPNSTANYIVTDYRLSTSISNAGGVMEDADLEHVQVFNARLGTLKTVNLFDLIVHGSVDEDVLLKPSDVIYIPRLSEFNDQSLDRLKLVGSSIIGKHEYPIRIQGFVTHPEIYYLKPDEMTLQSIITKAGGFTSQADPRKITIARTKADGHLEKVELNSTTLDVALQPNDIILVNNKNTATKVANVLDMISRLIHVPLATTFVMRNINGIWPFGTANKTNSNTTTETNSTDVQ